MSSVLRSVRKRKKGCTLGAVDVIDREGYAELEVDAKVELIRSLVPLGLLHIEGVARRGSDRAGWRTLRPQRPVSQGIRERFGGIGDGVARGLRLRHDHGSNYLADDFQQEVAFFGIQSSPSFVREPEGNGVAERFIRTLKENLLWVRSFATIEELRLALLAFKRTYNEQWMLEKHDYRSPAQVRRDLVGLDAAA